MKVSRCLGLRAAEVAAFSLLTVFWFAGCGSGPSSDDVLEDLDSMSTDLVDVTDAGTDIAVPRDTTFADVDGDNPVADIVSDIVPDSPDVSCGSCTGGKICVEGECQCPATQEDCGGTCTTLGTNEDCSECGDQCPTGGNCEAGTCRCPSGQVDCSGACTSTGTDDNCSECGDACVGVKICQNKECVAEVDPECLPSVPCVTDEDCVSGNRCNQAIFPPACQKLYCGGFGTACSEDYFCLSVHCNDDACINDCGGLECGPDPVYGESCGTCQEGATCRSNHCVCEPQDHLECVAGNSTWIDSCGNVGEVKEGCPLACLNGACVDCEAVGKMNCSGTCTLIGTTTNCSECGDVCPTGGSCNEGSCECPVGKADCSGACTLLGTNTNCAGCGDSCTGGKECNDGTCECQVGEADCFGTCTLMGTNTNCSGCGDACPTGGSCDEGTCDCPVDEADCSGTCTLLGTNSNCSGCDDKCDGFAMCVNGKCDILDCATCTVNEDCGTSYRCLPVGSNEYCLRDCNNSGDCQPGYGCYTTGNQKSCVPVSYNCVACAHETPCEEGMCCDFSTGTCKECLTSCSECVNDYNCAAGLRCYKTIGSSSGVCVAECPLGVCEDSQIFDCAENGSGTNICKPTTDTCSGCMEPTPHLLNEHCVECRVKEDCGNKHLCKSYSCVPENMVLIPGGSFWMGCDDTADPDCWDIEKPSHYVTLSRYYIHKKEVTQGAYAECVAAGKCSHHMDDGSCEYFDGSGVVSGTLPAMFRGANRPMVCVDWYQSEEYCEWLGARLPTEAEWEKAARGTDNRIYPWGNEKASCEFAVMFDWAAGGFGCGTGAFMDVCSKSPAGDSPYGLCDMGGNVSEFVSDWFATYSSGSVTNPQGPDGGNSRVIHGGSFIQSQYYDGFYQRASWRNGVYPSTADGSLGFRCAKDAQ